MLRKTLTLALFFFIKNSFSQELPYPSCSSCSISFAENKNQWDARIKYLMELGDDRVILENNAFTFDFKDKNALENIYKKTKGHGAELTPEEKIIRGHVYKVSFLNSRSDVKFETEEPLAGYRNYFLGKDKSKWAGKVKEYRKISYKNLYSGIDANVYGQNGAMKYDFIVAANTDVRQIKMSYAGADEIILREGNLIIKTSVNEVMEQKPFAYQMINGEQKEIECKFVLKKEFPSSISHLPSPLYNLSFEFPNGYDKSKTLVIDPTLIFSTYSGSTADNWGFTATYDYKGNTYSGGIVFVSGGGQYPVSVGAYQTIYGGGNFDAAIIKYDSAGQNRLYATYLGGAGEDRPHSLVVNNNNELLILGTTNSVDFPVEGNSYDSTFNGVTDIFVSKLSEDGSQLPASTFIGGSGNDGLNTAYMLNYNYGDFARGDITVDANNNLYIASCTRSNNFPVSAIAFQNSFGGGSQDGCVFKLDNYLRTMIWSSFIGGDSSDAAYSIALDNDGNVVVAGGTMSADFPASPGAWYPALQGVSDGFITHISQNGENIINSTFFGDTLYDQCFFVQLDRQNNVYVFGQTESSDSTFIFNAPYSKVNSGQFIAKLNPMLTNLDFSTVFGSGSGINISPTAFLVDVCEKIYVSGWGGGLRNNIGPNTFTSGMDITADVIQSTTDGEDFYLMVMTGDASSLVYATYFGGNGIIEHVDGGTSRFDKKGIVYQSICGACGGRQDSTITTPGAWARLNQSTNCNNMVFRLNFDFPPLNADFIPSPVIGCAPLTTAFQNNSTLGIFYDWDFGDDSVSVLENPIHTFTEPGIYNVRLIVRDTTSCNPNDTVFKQIIVLNDTSYTLPPDTVCEGAKIQIGLNTGGDTTLTYRWVPAGSVSDSTIPNPVAQPDSNTLYSLYISNGFCIDTIFQMVYVNTINAGANATICIGDAIQLGMPQQANTTYHWIQGQGLSDTAISNPIATPDTTTKYILKILASGCVRYDTVNVNVIFDSLYVVPNLISCKGQGIQIGVEPGGITFFRWSPTTGLSDSTITNPLALPDITTPYTFYYSNGICTDSIMQTVFVYVADAGTDSAECPNAIIQLGGPPQAGATYSWTPTSGLDFPATSNPTASVSTSTTYYLTVDAGVCRVYDTVNVLVLKNSVSNFNRYICKDDSVRIGIIFGGNVNFNWNPTDYLSDSTITNPYAKSDTSISYTLTMSNGNCFDTLIYTVIPHAAIAGNDTTICFGESVPLGVPYQASVNWYEWVPNTFLNNWWNSSVISTPDTSITYVVTMAMTTCERTDTVRVGVVKGEFSNLAPKSACVGDSLQIGLTPSGIDSVIWFPTTGLSDSLIINPVIKADSNISYTLYHFSADKSCVDTLQQNISVWFANAGMDTTICIGDTIQIGMNSQGINYTWTPNIFLSNNKISSPLAFPNTTTTYILRITDGNCIRRDTATVGVLLNKSYSLPLDTICQGDTVQIGVGNISFQSIKWTPSDSLSNPNITDPLAFPDTTTLFSLEIFNGTCTDTVRQNLVVVFADAGMDTSICIGESVMIGNALNQGINYLWTPDIFLNDNTIANPIATPDDTITYLVTVTTSNCVRQDAVNVKVIPVSAFAGTDTLICFGDTIQIGMTNNLQQYTWTPSTSLSNPSVPNPFAFPHSTTTYFLTAENSNCFAYDSVYVEVEDSMGSDFEIYVDLTCQGLKVLFVNNSRKASNYYWDFGDGDTSYLPTPWHYYSDNKPYLVTLRVDNGERCSYSVTKEIFPYEEYFRHHIPNVFTPNGDGQNDCFQLGIADLPQGCYSLIIYNRWGEIVSESYHPEICWNGKLRSTGEDVAEGVYFYILKVRQLTFTGFVEVIR